MFDFKGSFAQCEDVDSHTEDNSNDEEEEEEEEGEIQEEELGVQFDCNLFGDDLPIPPISPQ